MNVSFIGKIHCAAVGAVGKRDIDFTIFAHIFYIGFQVVADVDILEYFIMINNTRMKIVDNYFIAYVGALCNDNFYWVALPVVGRAVIEEFIYFC